MKVNEILESLDDDPFASKEEHLEYLKEKKHALKKQLNDEEGPLIQIQNNQPGKILSYAGTDRIPDKVQAAHSAYAYFDLNSYHATPALVKHPIASTNTVRYWVPKDEPILVNIMKKLTKKMSMLSYKIAEVEVQEYKLLVDDVRILRAKRAEERKAARGTKRK